MAVLEHVEKSFDIRKNKVLQLIQKSNIKYREIGIYGSYSRREFMTDSDIDFCIIVDKKPDRHISGLLREEAEMLGADIIFITKNYFDTDKSLFAKNLRNDYKRIV